MNPTLMTHRNILAELADVLEAEGKAYKRDADVRIVAAAGLKGEGYTNAVADANYRRGAQDAHANIVGRLRSILAAPLSTIVDVGEVFDAVEAALGANDATSSTKPVTPHTAARIAAEVIDGRNVGGPR